MAAIVMSFVLSSMSRRKGLQLQWGAGGNVFCVKNRQYVFFALILCDLTLSSDGLQA